MRQEEVDRMQRELITASEKQKQELLDAQLQVIIYICVYIYV